MLLYLLSLSPDTFFSYSFRNLPVVRFRSHIAHIFYSSLPRVFLFFFSNFQIFFRDKLRIFMFFFCCEFSVTVPSSCLIRLKFYTHLLLVITQGLFIFRFSALFRQKLGKLTFFDILGHFFSMLFVTFSLCFSLDSVETLQAHSNHEFLGSYYFFFSNFQIFSEKL